MSDKLSKAIKLEIDKINEHLPRKTLDLRMILRLEKKGLYLRNGQFHQFDEPELQFIADLIPQQYWGQVLLPIILTRRRDQGSGVFTVSGSIPNLYIIRHVLGETKSFDIWRLQQEKREYVYRLELRKIRQKLKTTTVMAFS